MIVHSKPHLDCSDIQVIKKVISSGLLSNGPHVRAFSDALMEYLNTQSLIMTINGREALFIALRQLDIGMSDEVIIPSYVCREVLDAVERTGAKATICDIGSYWAMTPESVEKCITKATKAIILVHIFGIAINAYEFKQFGIPIIEDCCQALGANTNGQQVGAMGELAIFSFDPIKCLTTLQGGAVIMNDHFDSEWSKALFNGEKNRSGFTEIHAVLGLNQLAKYEKMLERRREIAKEYFEKLHPTLTAKLAEVSNSIYYRFPLTLKNKYHFEKLKAEFENRDICVRRGVDDLIHRIKGLDDLNFPNATDRFDRTLSIPIYPMLKEKEITQIVKVTNELLCSTQIK